MKAKIVNGKCVAIMSHREAAFIAAIMATAPAGGFEEVGSIGNCLWPIYDYPEDGIASTINFIEGAPEKFDDYMDSMDISEEHYA